MKMFLFLFMTSLMSFYSYGNDVNVCNTLASVVSLNQERFDQAEIALSDLDAICRDEVYPKICVDEIKKEYSEAKVALQESQTAYKNAGCEELIPAF